MTDLSHKASDLIALLREHPELLHDPQSRAILEELALVIHAGLADANTATLRMVLSELGENFNAEEQDHPDSMRSI